MLKKIGFVFLLGAFSTVVQAQSLDGTYRDKLTKIRDIERVPGAGRCAPTGSPIEFRVTGSIIETTAPRSGQVFSTPLANDGSFRISGQQPADRPGMPILLEWNGVLKNSRIVGTLNGRATGRDCDFTLSATKQGRK